ncbi:EndoU domain-containing protein [Clostridium sp. B9]
MVKKIIKNNFIKLFLGVFLIAGILTGCSANNVSTPSNDNKSTEQQTINSISDLKHVENFQNGALEHILEGEINSRGKAVGFHYEDFPGGKGKVIEGTKSKPNKEGVYTAKVEVDGVKKTSNNGKSSFFPDDWTPQQVVDAINEAYKDKEFVKGSKNTYVGETKDGMEISMYINDKTGKIISAFPVY